MSPNPPQTQVANQGQSAIHATNAWNPTGRNLLRVPGTRLFYVHAEALNGPRTFVLLGNQQHLTFVADVEGHVDRGSLRQLTIDRYGLYPHLVDLEPARGLPRVLEPSPGSVRMPEPAPVSPRVIDSPHDLPRPLEVSTGLKRAPEGDSRQQARL